MRKYVRYFVIGLVVLLGADAAVIVAKWPFSRQAQIRSLSHILKSQVAFGKYEVAQFPHPGFDAEDVHVVRQFNGHPVTLAVAKHIECRSSWFDLLTLTHRAFAFDVDGLEVTIPSPVPPAMDMFPNQTTSATASKIVADGAALAVFGNHFQFPRLQLSEVGQNKAIGYDIQAKLVEYRATAIAQGSTGPFTSGRIPLQGTFQLRNLDLASASSLLGTLAASGHYNGELNALRVAGSANLENFHLQRVPHPVGMSAEYETVVDCRKGNATINRFSLHVQHTNVQASGTLQDRVVAAEFRSAGARLEDLFTIFDSAPKPPVSGAIQFVANAELPPGKEAFLHRLKLTGKFAIRDGRMTHEVSQEKLDQLSERARSKRQRAGTDPKDPPVVSASLDAQVKAAKGIAYFSSIVLQVPSATARASGTYDLLHSTYDLTGKLDMKAALSTAAGGLKGLFLLPLDPFFKKGKAGSEIPIRVTGPSAHPQFKAKL